MNPSAYPRSKSRSQSCLLPVPCWSKSFWAIMFNSAGVGNFASRGACSPALSNPIRCPFLWCSAVSGAMRVECRHPAHDKRRHRHPYKKPQRFELSWHEVAVNRSRESVSMELRRPARCFSQLRYAKLTTQSCIEAATDGDASGFQSALVCG